MSDYRVYIIGIDGHRFIKVDQFKSDHPDDATAMKAAQQLVDGYDVELWDCGRLVGRIAHKSRTNAICEDQTKASGSDADLANLILANLRVEASPKAADLRSKVDVSTAPDPPRDESAIIHEDDGSGTYDVAHWSPEAVEWVGENGEPTKITPSPWYSTPREKYLSLESDGSSNPSQVRPSPACAHRYATSSIAAALVAAALIGTYFREDVAALVTRYAGQQDIFGGSTIGEQVVVRGTQLQNQDSQKTNSSALRQQEEAEADQASAHKAAQVKLAAEGGTVGLRKSQRQEEERAKRLEQDLAAARRDVETQTALAAKASKEAGELKQAAKSAAVELRKSLQQEQERAKRLEQDLAAARRDVETQTAQAAKASDEAGQLKQVAESGSAELKRSLQQEHDRAALGSARAAPAAPKLDQNAQDKQLEANADQASVAGVRGAAPPNPEDAVEIARLMARASVLLGQGDIGSARIVLERAAEKGNAEAIFSLAETYDPLILPKWGTYGTRGDAMTALDLYAKAQAGGILEAKERIDALRP